MFIRENKNVTKKLLLVILVATSLSISLPSYAGPFDKGSVRLGVVFGSGSAFNDTYTIFGLGVGYYVLDGLELGLDYQNWSGGTPGIQQLTPGIQYVIRNKSFIQPYVGAFYRRTYIDGLDDTDAYGYRLGVYAVTGPNVFIGLGAVHSIYRDCNETVFVSCSDTYPEVTIGFSI